jgi:hypothetical protein
MKFAGVRRQLTSPDCDSACPASQDGQGSRRSEQLQHGAKDGFEETLSGVQPCLAAERGDRRRFPSPLMRGLAQIADTHADDPQVDHAHDEVIDIERTLDVEERESTRVPIHKDCFDQ